MTHTVPPLSRSIPRLPHHKRISNSERGPRGRPVFMWLPGAMKARICFPSPSRPSVSGSSPGPRRFQPQVGNRDDGRRDRRGKKGKKRKMICSDAPFTLIHTPNNADVVPPKLLRDTCASLKGRAGTLGVTNTLQGGTGRN